MRPGLRITVLDWITGIFSLFKKFHLLSSSLYIFRQTGTHTHTHISFWNTFLHIVADFRKRQKANKADLLKPLNSYSNYLVMLNMKLKIFDTKPVYIIKVFSLDKLLPWVFSRKSPKSFLFIWHYLKIVKREKKWNSTVSKQRTRFEFCLFSSRYFNCSKIVRQPQIP